METAEPVLDTNMMPLNRPPLVRGPYRYGNREHLGISNRTDRAEPVS
jgi:acetoacetate decarboxylase